MATCTGRSSTISSGRTDSPRASDLSKWIIRPLSGPRAPRRTTTPASSARTHWKSNSKDDIRPAEYTQTMTDHTPFREPLQPSEINKDDYGFANRLRELKDTPGKIIRFQDLTELRPDNARFEGLTDVREIASTGKRLFGEMEERYGIPASVEFVIGHGERDEREGIYGVQDKINGRSPLDASFTAERELALREMTALYDKLIHYYEDKHAEGDFYL